jgi:hypothetical protein
MMGTWEWLIIVFLAIAVAWRFWPKSWRFTPRVRFSVRWLMIAVLVVGLICGGFARWYARQARRQGLIAQLHIQQQVTNSAIHAMRADLAAAGRKDFSFLTRSAFEIDKWDEQLDAYEGQDDRRMPLIFVEVSGGCEEDLLRPITIKTSGASMEGQLLDRLTSAYRSRGWQHMVISLPAGHK